MQAHVQYYPALYTISSVEVGTGAFILIASGELTPDITATARYFKLSRPGPYTDTYLYIYRITYMHHLAAAATLRAKLRFLSWRATHYQNRMHVGLLGVLFPHR